MKTSSHHQSIPSVGEVFAYNKTNHGGIRRFELIEVLVAPWIAKSNGLLCVRVKVKDLDADSVEAEKTLHVEGIL